MFARVKELGRHHYLQIVENKKIKGKVIQRVIVTLGRVNHLQEKDLINYFPRRMKLDILRIVIADFNRYLTSVREGSRDSLKPKQISERLLRFNTNSVVRSFYVLQQCKSISLIILYDGFVIFKRYGMSPQVRDTARLISYPQFPSPCGKLPSDQRASG